VGPPLHFAMQELQERLHAHVEKLAGEIGERNVFHPARLAEAADYIDQQWQARGHAVHRQVYPSRDVEVANLEIVRPGITNPDEIVIIGAHYDSVINSPGANDNATGVAALLEISRRLQDQAPARTMRFVAFVNEEPPFYRTGEMGSLVYARACKRHGDNIVAMLCLETLGCYSDRPKSQHYPFPLGMFYPDIATLSAWSGIQRGGNWCGG
jgi:Zn-dependent M28 family amino/carboxypeptidase